MDRPAHLQFGRKRGPRLKDRVFDPRARLGQQMVMLVPGLHHAWIGQLPELLVERGFVGPVQKPAPIQEHPVDALSPVVAGGSPEHLDGFHIQPVCPDHALDRRYDPRTCSSSRLYQGTEISHLVDHARPVLNHQDIHQALANPLHNVHSQRVAAGQVGGHPHQQLAAGAAASDRLRDALHPLGKDGTPLFYAVRSEEIGVTVQVELEAVHRVSPDRLLHDGEAFVPCFPMSKIQTPEAGILGVHVPLGADFQVFVVPTEVGDSNPNGPLAPFDGRPLNV